MSRATPLPQRTVRDSLRWIGKDIVVRLLPFAAIALVWAFLLEDGTETLKLTWKFTWLDVALVLGTGIPAFAACSLYYARFWPIRNLASKGSHLVEDGYFLFFNAPAEELFFRGMLQSWAMSLGFVPPAVGFVVIALVFGFYHRLAKFPFHFLLLATAGGFLFGTLFLLSNTILTPILVHFIADLALFNLGPTLLVRQNKIAYRVVRPRSV